VCIKLFFKNTKTQEQLKSINLIKKHQNFKINQNGINVVTCDRKKRQGRSLNTSRKKRIFLKRDVIRKRSQIKNLLHLFCQI